MSVTQREDGLEVLTGDSGYRKLRAAQQGLYYWDKSCQQVILDALGEFLPRVTEMTSDVGSVARFQKIIGGKEVCHTSTALGSGRIARDQLSRLEGALRTLRAIRETVGVSPEARMLAEKFALPDPARLPEFYRVYQTAEGAHLLILWGCENTPLDSISPEAAIGKLKKEGVIALVTRRFRWLAVVLAILAVGVLLLLLYLAWPQAHIQTSRDTVIAADVLRLRFAGSRGSSFELTANGAAVVAHSGNYAVEERGPGVVASWAHREPRAVSPQSYLDLSYSSPGSKELHLTAHGTFFGVPLPDAKARINVHVEELPAAPEPTTSSIAPPATFKSGRLTVALNSSPGEFPAKISATSTQDGELDFNGARVPSAANTPIRYEGFTRPGRYKVSFIPGDGSGDRKSDDVYLRLDPPAGAPPIVAHLRVTPAIPKSGEKILADASGSFHADPESSIARRELSADGGKTFNAMSGNFEVMPPRAAGPAQAILRVTDDKGRVAEDRQDFNVVEGAPLPSQPISAFSGASGERTITVSAPDNVLFETGSANLSEAGMQMLASFGHKMSAQPYVVQITGHTDDRPVLRRFPNNMALSQARADAAAQFLIEEAALPADRVKSVGMGDLAPVVPNTNESSRAKNRRIEITLLPLSDGADPRQSP